MKVLICGAGIAGLTLAYWLNKNGIECTLIEKANNIRTEGYMIDFGGTGWDVADRMALIPELRAKKAPIDLINYRNAKGDITAQIHAAQLYQAADVEGKFMTLNRSDLIEVIYHAVKDQVKICFDTTINSICQSEDDVTVSLSDGTQANYDLVVGADGIHSRVRQLAFGQESTFDHYLAYHFAVFVIPAPAISLEPAFHMYLEPDKQVSILPLSDSEWMIYIVYHSDMASVPARHERKASLEHILGDMGWIVPDVLQQVHEDTHIFWDTVTQIQLPRWSSNRVVLIGDAAHCPTLISGQGASMAMAGAYFLAQELVAKDNYQIALSNYENRLRPHIETIQKKARNFAPNFVPSSHMRIRMVNWIVRFIDLPFLSRLVGKQFSLKSILESS